MYLGITLINRTLPASTFVALIVRRFDCLIEPLFLLDALLLQRLVGLTHFKSDPELGDGDFPLFFSRQVVDKIRQHRLS